MRRWFVSLLLLSGVGVAAALLNNNISFLPTSRAAFGAEFELAVQVGIDWIVANPDEANPALLYMIADMSWWSGLRFQRFEPGTAQSRPRRHNGKAGQSVGYTLMLSVLLPIISVVARMCIWNTTPPTHSGKPSSIFW
jgi:hypothetical protein